MIESVEALRRDDHHRAARAAKGFEMNATKTALYATAYAAARANYDVALAVHHAACANYRAAVRENDSAEDLRFFDISRRATAQAYFAASNELAASRAAADAND